jgi:putative DNA methylase
MTVRKKLIEVALPLEAINEASSREKSIRHGHPSTLHLWWARRPLAACRAILFGQLVDDPSSVPEEFPDEKAQEKERKRLFKIIEDLVRWENSNNERVIYAARREIARSVARACGEAPPKTNAEIDRCLAEKAPPVLDPFCGGGSIPLEAQRLGLRAYASDLNPVAVLITKALIEIPPKFAGRPPVNPEARAKFANGVAWNGRGAQGLAEDVRYYGRWIRDEAEKRIGHLYPKAKLPGGSQATVIAWLWARTVKCPNPACGAEMPLVRSFALSTKKGKEAWVEPAVDRSSTPPTVWFEVKTEKGKRSEGTTDRKGARCVCCGAPVPFNHIRAEGKADRLGVRLLAIVADSLDGRTYLPPSVDHERVVQGAQPHDVPDTDLPDEALGFRVQNYGMTKHRHLFTNRQLVALTTFCDLVGGVRAKVFDDSESDHNYADAVVTYLAFSVGKVADRNSTIAGWAPNREHARNTFTRQAISMTWDFAESNIFSDSSGNFFGGIESISSILGALFPGPTGSARQVSATNIEIQSTVFSTDPPYYDNVPYADLSDFFYVWLRSCLRPMHPDLLGTVLVPKVEELVADPFRHGGKEHARSFFEREMGRVFERMRGLSDPWFPITVYYAFKQTENGDCAHEVGDEPNSERASTGWQTFLQGLVDTGWQVVGTWPMRTELGRRMRNFQSNALASSIILACRPRPEDAPVATRRDFVTALKRELPEAVRRLQGLGAEGLGARASRAQAAGTAALPGIAPVDLAQAAIGPGMAVFSRYAKVLEADGTPMRVRAALVEINRVLDETLAEQESDLDAGTRFCVTWYGQHGVNEGPYGDAEVLVTARAISVQGLEDAGVVVADKGKARLKCRDEMEPAWDPRTDRRLTDWKCVQHLVRAMTAEAGGGVAEAARLAHAMGPARAETARALAYRLYTIADRKGWTDEALAYNVLVTSWPQIQAEAAKLAEGPREPKFALRGRGPR